VNPQEEDRAVEQVIDRLAEKFPDAPRLHIVQTVLEQQEALSGNPVRDYVPVLIERAAKNRLRSSPAG
jgi:hypothetical protein